MKTKLLVSAIMSCVLLLGATTASAVFIDGAITMSGDYAPTGGTGLSDATGIDFLADDFAVDDATGDFAAAGIGFGDIGIFQDFDFAPLNPAPVDPLWSIAGFAFSLESVSVDFQDNSFIILAGSGTLSAAGFDDTLGTWSLTANNAGRLFNFSSGTVATGITEPASLLLVGIGIIGMATTRRRRG